MPLYTVARPQEVLVSYYVELIIAWFLGGERSYRKLGEKEGV